MKIETSKKPAVSVGIPAYNEEGNIRHLLDAILNQKEFNFNLQEIIVVSDGSSDKTVEIARGINDSRILAIDSKERKGQAERQNEIIKLFKGDILVLLNADILPVGDSFLSDFISPIIDNPKVGLVGCKNASLKPRTFFEKILNLSRDFKNSIYKELDGGNNIYLCSGAARVFSKDFAKKITWQTSVAEDAYSYLECVSNKYEFKFSEKAQVYVRAPDNFRDHMKQSARFMGSKNILSKYFNKNLISNSYFVPKKIIFMNSIKYFFKNPILFSCYALVFVYIKLFSNKDKFSINTWSPSASSKTLIS